MVMANTDIHMQAAFRVVGAFSPLGEFLDPP